MSSIVLYFATAFALKPIFYWQSAIKVSKQNAHISLTNILFQHNNNSSIYETNKQSIQKLSWKKEHQTFFLLCFVSLCLMSKHKAEISYNVNGVFIFFESHLLDSMKASVQQKKQQMYKHSKDIAAHTLKKCHKISKLTYFVVVVVVIWV